MPTSIRLLRAALQPELDQRLPLTPRDRQRREAILDFGEKDMARFGRPNLNLTRFAAAIRLSPHTIKRLFADLDALLGDILRRHLGKISKTLGDIPADAPDRPAKLRAAYLEATRTPLGGFTEAHLLLIRDRHFLPDDERASVESMRDGLGELLAGSLAAAALDLLDAPNLTPAQIEFLVTQLPAAPLEAPAPASPSPPPEPQAPEPPPRTLRLFPAHATKHPDDPPIEFPLPPSAPTHPQAASPMPAAPPTG